MLVAATSTDRDAWKDIEAWLKRMRGRINTAAKKPRLHRTTLDVRIAAGSCVRSPSPLALTMREGYIDAMTLGSWRMSVMTWAPSSRRRPALVTPPAQATTLMPAV